MDPQTRAALDEALDDEYKARATYKMVIDAFGPIRPFVNIVESEARHISALLSLYEAFDLTPPEDNWAGRVDAPASIADACRGGVGGEVENAAMYERLIENVTDPAVKTVLAQLQAASRDNHLPAFKRCLAREESGRSGRRRGGSGHRHRGGRGPGA